MDFIQGNAKSGVWEGITPRLQDRLGVTGGGAAVQKGH